MPGWDSAGFGPRALPPRKEHREGLGVSLPQSREPLLVLPSSNWSHLAGGTKAAGRLAHSRGTPTLPVLIHVPPKEPAPPPHCGHSLIAVGTVRGES